MRIRVRESRAADPRGMVQVYTLADLGFLEGMQCEPVADKIFMQLDLLRRAAVVEDLPMFAESLVSLKQLGTSQQALVKVGQHPQRARQDTDPMLPR
eukprot:2532016-Pyramimonas_sp.AAC.1